MRNLIGEMFKGNNNMFRISAPRNIFLVIKDFSNFSVLFCFVILFNVGHKTKVAHIYLHIHLLMAITITILSISRPPLNYACCRYQLSIICVCC